MLRIQPQAPSGTDRSPWGGEARMGGTRGLIRRWAPASGPRRRTLAGCRSWSPCARKVDADLRAAHPGAQRPAGAPWAPIPRTECAGGPQPIVECECHTRAPRVATSQISQP